MKFDKYSNEVKVPLLLNEIYEKLAGDNVEEIENINKYANDTKIPILLEKIYDVIDTGEDDETDSTGIVTVNITPNTHIGAVTGGTMDKTYSELLSASEAGNLIVAYIRIGNGGGPDARAIPLAYDGVGSLVGASVMWYYGASKLYELKIEITSSACNVAGRAVS